LFLSTVRLRAIDPGPPRVPIARRGDDRTVAGMTTSTPPAGAPTSTTTTTDGDPWPSCFQLLRNWIDRPEADRLLESLTATVPWEQSWITMYGKSCPTPRLTYWVGDAAYSYSGIRNQAHNWLPELAQLRERLEATSAARYNSCLLNLYRDGADTVGWHRDNERGLDPRDPIASISLGADRDFMVREIDTKQTWTIPLQHGDLLLMSGPDSQTRYVHAVTRRKRLLDARINLTYRFYRAASQG
jgi:alkylated DNA repair dioxygenase AlkB